MLHGADTQLFLWQHEATDDSSVVGTGFTAFDSVLKRGGLRRGHVAALLGRSNVGKTALACNVIRNMVFDGHSVLFSSQEMRAEEVTNRLLAIAYDLPVNELESWLQQGKVGQPLLNQYREDFAKFAIYDSKEPTFEDLRKEIATFQEMTGAKPDVLVQDYMTLMSSQGLFGAMPERVGRVARNFEILAKTEQVAVITLVQVGRANEGDPTKRNHGHIPLTMESGMYGGEQAFDVMFGMYRPELDPELHDPSLDGDAWYEAQAKLERWRGKAVLQTVKNRFGPTNLVGGEVSIDWNTMRFKGAA